MRKPSLDRCKVNFGAVYYIRSKIQQDFCLHSTVFFVFQFIYHFVFYVYVILCYLSNKFSYSFIVRHYLVSNLTIELILVDASRYLNPDNKLLYILNLGKTFGTN